MTPAPRDFPLLPGQPIPSQESKKRTTRRVVLNQYPANYGAIQDGQWFPATGTRVYEGGGLDFPDPANGGNPYSGLWIGTAGSASAHNHYGQYMYIINGKRTFKVNKDSRSQGLSLRCVVE